MVRLRQQGYTDAGPVKVSGTHNMDLFYGSAKYSEPSFTATNQAAYGSAEAGMMKWAATAGVGATGSKGLNTQIISGEVNVFHAKAEGEWNVFIGKMFAEDPPATPAPPPTAPLASPPFSGSSTLPAWA